MPQGSAVGVIVGVKVLVGVKTAVGEEVIVGVQVGALCVSKKEIVACTISVARLF
jgi:hypothetical protein